MKFLIKYNKKLIFTLPLLITMLTLTAACTALEQFEDNVSLEIANPVFSQEIVEDDGANLQRQISNLFSGNKQSPTQAPIKQQKVAYFVSFTANNKTYKKEYQPHQLEKSDNFQSNKLYLSRLTIPTNLSAKDSTTSPNHHLDLTPYKIDLIQIKTPPTQSKYKPLSPKPNPQPKPNIKK